MYSCVKHRTGNRIGLLGADYEIANGRYRFKKIYRSTDFYTPRTARLTRRSTSPASISAKEITFWKSRQKSRSEPKIFSSYFEIPIGKPVKITVSGNVDGTNPRTSIGFSGERRESPAQGELGGK